MKSKGWKIILDLAVLGAVIGTFLNLPAATREFFIISYIAWHIWRATGAKA